MLAPGKAVRVKGQGVPYMVYGQTRRLSQRDIHVSTTRQKEKSLSHHEEQLEVMLSSSTINIGMNASEGLRKICWAGVPLQRRAEVWRLLCEYLPSSASRRDKEHARKVNEYSDFVTRYFDVKSLSVPQERAIIHQIGLDLPRHKLALYHIPLLVKPLERMLYIWSLRHPAVGYVQGMDDIIASFYLAFLADQLERCGLGPEVWSLVCTTDEKALSAVLWTNDGPLSEAMLRQAEADTYWCGGKVLAWAQDNFVHGLRGVHGMVLKLQDLMDKADSDLSLHLHNQGVELQFTFQWMHCLLTRELPHMLSMRLWDTYLCIGPSFYEFHIYICCALLVNLSSALQTMNTEAILAAVKKPVPDNATCAWMDEVIATAYMLRLRHPPNTVWKGASSAPL